MPEDMVPLMPCQMCPNALPDVPQGEGMAKWQQSQSSVCAWITIIDSTSGSRRRGLQMCLGALLQS